MSGLEPGFLERLRAHVRRRVPSSADADDVVQTVLLRLLQADLPESASTHAWLLTTTRSAVADLHRARGRPDAPAAGLRAVDAAEPAGPEREEASGITDCLFPLLRTLEPEDARLLTRIDVEGEAQVDVARELSLSVSALKSRVQRARARLREALVTHCVVEWGAKGMPVGPASCRPGPSAPGCGCGEVVRPDDPPACA